MPFKRARRIVYEANTQIIELIYSFKLALWSIFFLLLRWDYVKVVPGLLPIVDRFGGTMLWVTVLWCAAFLQFYSVLHKDYPKFRWIASLLSCAVWSFSAAAIFFTEPKAYYWAICMFEALVNVWIVRHRTIAAS